MSIDDDLILLLSPLVLADVRVQVVVPTLSALLADAARQLLSNEAPVFGAVFLDQSQNQLILQLRLR